MTYRARCRCGWPSCARRLCRCRPRAQAPDAARLAAAKELMEVAGVAKQFDEVMPLLTDQLSAELRGVAPDKAERSARCSRSSLSSSSTARAS